MFFIVFWGFFKILFPCKLGRKLMDNTYNVDISGANCAEVLHSCDCPHILGHLALIYFEYVSAKYLGLKRISCFEKQWTKQFNLNNIIIIIFCKNETIDISMPLFQLDSWIPLKNFPVSAFPVYCFICCCHLYKANRINNNLYSFLSCLVLGQTSDLI